MFPMKKFFGLHFPRIIDSEKPHGTIDNFPKSFLAKTRSFIIISVTRNWLLETQKFEKKGNLSHKDKLWLFLSVLSSVTNLKE